MVSQTWSSAPPPRPFSNGGMIMRAIWTRLAPGIATLALALASGAANADCDFLTGGGFIIRTPPSPDEASGAHGNFGVGGACKDGGDAHGLWGHLEYIDHGTGTSTQTQLPLNAHWITITDYREVFTSAPDPKTHQPLGARYICGTARTNQAYGDVNFVVYAEDKGEPGVDDVFWIRLTQPVGQNVPQHTVYTTEHDSDNTLGGPGSGGGNIQLHKRNNASTGSFGFAGHMKCPAYDYCNGA